MIFQSFLKKYVKIFSTRKKKSGKKNPTQFNVKMREKRKKISREKNERMTIDEYESVNV